MCTLYIFGTMISYLDIWTNHITGTDCTKTDGLSPSLNEYTLDFPTNQVVDDAGGTFEVSMDCVSMQRVVIIFSTLSCVVKRSAAAAT